MLVDSLGWLFPIASGGDEKPVWQHASDYAVLIGPTRAIFEKAYLSKEIFDLIENKLLDLLQLWQ
jgi:hypothetical protein